MSNAEIAHEYWQRYAEAFAYPIGGNGLLSQFIANPVVTGAYAEAWVKSLCRTMLPQFRISTGAVIRPTDAGRGLRNVPQCDLIIWDPAELPALFEQGDFALVPLQSTRGLIEIKRKCSNLGELSKQLESRKRLLHHRHSANIFGVVVSHRNRLFTEPISPDWITREREAPAMTRLLDASMKVDGDGVFALIYFLSGVAGRTNVV